MNNYLFAEFEESSFVQWQQQVAKELKDKSLDSLMLQLPQLSIEPYYTGFKNQEAQQPLFNNADWLIKQQFLVQDAKIANQEILKALANDVQVVGLIFQKATQFETFQELFSGVYLNMIQLHFDNNFLYQDLQHFIQYVEQQNFNTNELNLSINTSALLQERKKDEVKNMITLLAEKSIPHKTFAIALKDNAANNVVDEIQQAFSQLESIYSWAKKENITDIAQQIFFIVPIAPHYFLQIAKLRAVRILWQQFLAKNNLPLVPAYIHAANASSYQSNIAHENILRHTTEAMSAVIGGCDVICLSSSDETEKLNSAFFNRINTNIQHLLKHESHFDKVQDMAAGSYYIENITAQIIKAIIV